MTRRFLVLVLALWALPAAADEFAGRDWTSPGGGDAKAHYSTLTGIAPANIGRLGLAWSADLGTDRVQEATPVVIDGVMYTSGNLGRVYAFDAASGRALWRFTPSIDAKVNRTVCCDQANRGVAVADGRVFVAALDGMLYALDAKSGRVLWRADTIIDRKRGYVSTGAPEVAGDLVVIGNSGAEFDVRGYVSAYRRDTGKLAWRFYVVPHDPAKGPQESPALNAALKTWDPHSRWDIGGGGTPWDAIVYDKRFDTVYVGTGNGGPYSRAIRSPSGGDNLYLSSLVALNAKTGALKWYFQETPQDSWDSTASQPMVLTDLAIGGHTRPVIIHAPKNGFLFVFDRETGEPLRINRLVYTNWASGFDPKTHRALLTPEHADYSTGPKIVFPSTAGARNWFPPAFDPQRKLYYASILDMGCLMFGAPGPAPHRNRALNAGATLIFTPDLLAVLPSLPPPIRDAVLKLPEIARVKARPFVSELRAIDPLTGKTKWAVPSEGWQDRGGVLATRSGLIFQGTAGGRLMVRASDSGRLLKAIETGTSILAAPMTYEVGGIQFVAVQAGWGGGGWSFVPHYAAAYRNSNANRLLVFKVGGRDVPLPPSLPPLTVAPPPPAQTPGVTPATILKGQGLFFANCAICHSNQLRSISPDLRRLPEAVHAQFGAIVLDGALEQGGMPGWRDVLAPSDADAIHAYLIDLQGKTRAHELELQRAGKPLDAPSRAVMSSY